MGLLENFIDVLNLFLFIIIVYSKSILHGALTGS